jgi:hypothetical protein
MNNTFAMKRLKPAENSNRDDRLLRRGKWKFGSKNRIERTLEKLESDWIAPQPWGEE